MPKFTNKKQKIKQETINKVGYLKPEPKEISLSPNFAIFCKYSANKLFPRFYVQSNFKGWSQLQILSNCINAKIFF